jgi:hypothetical protein
MITINNQPSKDIQGTDNVAAATSAASKMLTPWCAA